MNKKLYLLTLFIFIAGCKSGKIKELEERSAVVVFCMLIASIVYFKITPKLQHWRFTKVVVEYFVNKLSFFLILMMIVAGVFCYINGEPIAKLLAVNLCISSAFLYKLKKGYQNKSDNQKTNELRYLTVTLPSILALLFLMLGGIQSLMK